MEKFKLAMYKPAKMLEVPEMRMVRRSFLSALLPLRMNGKFFTFAYLVAK
ncbi:hypothetical protein L579_1355 [Pantoea sp. AS-PWVM4]|nr:hypothetical protein L579_1355 [Pantoea sp. AS-PWVM4]